MVNSPSANAGDARDIDLIPGSGRSPGGGNGNHSSILAWKIPWTEEPSGYSPWGGEESDTTDQLSMHNVRNQYHIVSQLYFNLKKKIKRGKKVNHTKE